MYVSITLRDCLRVAWQRSAHLCAACVVMACTVAAIGELREWEQSLIFTCRCLVTQFFTFATSFTSLTDALTRLDASDKDGKGANAVLPGDGDVPRRLHELAWTTVAEEDVLPFADGTFKLSPNKGTMRLVTTADAAVVPVRGRMAGSMKKGVRVEGVVAHNPATGAWLLDGHWNKYNEDKDAPAHVKAEWKCEACTVRNSGTATTCATCGAAAPPPKFVHRFDAPAPCTVQLARSGAAFNGEWSRASASGGWLGIRPNLASELGITCGDDAAVPAPVLTLAPRSARDATVYHPYASVHSLPKLEETGAFAVEAWVCIPPGAGAAAQPQTVVSSGAFGIGLTADLQVVAWRRAAEHPRGGPSYHAANVPALPWWLGSSAAPEHSSDLSSVVSPTAVQPGQWTHVGAHYDGTTLTVVVDGVASGATPSGPLRGAPDAPMLIGADLVRARYDDGTAGGARSRADVARLGVGTLVGGYTPQRLLTGHIAGVRLWVLPDSAANDPPSALLTGDVNMPCTQPRCLAGAWPLTGALRVAADVSGCGRHAVIRFARPHAAPAATPAAVPFTVDDAALSPPAAPLALRGALRATLPGMDLYGSARHVAGQGLCLPPGAAAWLHSKLAVRGGFALRVGVDAPGVGVPGAGGESLWEASLGVKAPTGGRSVRVMLWSGSYWDLRPTLPCDDFTVSADTRPRRQRQPSAVDGEAAVAAGDGDGDDDAVAGAGDAAPAASPKAPESVSPGVQHSQAWLCIEATLYDGRGGGAGMMHLSVLACSVSGQQRCLARAWSLATGPQPVLGVR